MKRSHWIYAKCRVTHVVKSSCFHCNCIQSGKIHFNCQYILNGKPLTLRGLNHHHRLCAVCPYMLGASKHHNRVKNVKTFLHLWLRQILSSFLLFTGPEFFWCLIILLYKTAFQSFAVIFSCRRFSQHTSIIINTIKQIFINQLMSEKKVRFY